MASDTVPAAVTGPDDEAGSTTPAVPQQQPRGLAGLLSAVDPARPAFDLNPTLGGAQDTTAASTSSADYHGSENAESTDTKTRSGGTGKSGQSVIRAWLLAGAERWKQGGVARNKRLDMKKAQHQANQVKETRTVTVNKAPGIRSGGGASGGSGGGKGPAGKSLNSKTRSSGSSSTGPKNTNGSRGSSSHGSGGGTGRGPGSGSGHKSHTTRSNGSHSGSSTTPKQTTSGTRHGGDLKPRPKTDTSKTSGPQSTKGSSGKSSTASGGGTGGKPGKTGPQGSAGSSGKAPSSGQAGKSGSKTSPSPTGSRGSGSGTTPSKGSSDPQGQQGKGSKISLKKKRDPQTGKTTPSAGQTPQTSTDKTSKTNKTAPTTFGKRLNTQTSRETGYRDGTRAATLTAHVQAWGHGVRDGWNDTQKAAAAEKTRLDKAHTDRNNTRTPQRAEETTVPTPAPTVTPIEVVGTDSKTIYLGAGAARSSVSRGEVRNFVTFLARLEDKTTTMTKIAEATKGLEAEAEAQATEATQLLEGAKQAEGGEHLLGKLAKLAEAATVQAGKAGEVHKRALRAAEACKTLLANVTTRYQPIFKAVIDSPETRPAELAFYRDHGYAPAA